LERIESERILPKYFGKRQFPKLSKTKIAKKRDFFTLFSQKIAKIAKNHDFRNFCEFGNVRKARKLPKYFRNSKNGYFQNSQKQKFWKKTSNAGPYKR